MHRYIITVLQKCYFKCYSIDQDECSFGKDPCKAVSLADCVNTIGSYVCTCKDGFELNETSDTCVGELPSSINFIVCLCNRI